MVIDYPRSKLRLHSFFFWGGGGGFVPQGKYFLKGMFRELCYLCLAQVEI